MGFAFGFVASFAVWDEGYPRLALALPFLGVVLGVLVARAYAGSERPRIEMPPAEGSLPRDEDP